jgi:co-chaperonin GroES (HSP10)
MKKSNNIIKTPWTLDSGGIKFPYKALFSKVFIWRIPPKDKHGKGIIEIPKIYLDEYQDGTGIVLSIGPGYYSDNGKWNPSDDMIKVGDKVMFHKGIPWGITLKGLDGKNYHVTMCNMVDIFGVF